VRIEIARLLGWPENRIRVKVPFLGGGFGAKLYIKLEALVAALSLISKRPVKVSLTMEEQFFTITKHASTFRIKSGVTKDGRIVARDWRCGGTARLRRHRPARDAEVRAFPLGPRQDVRRLVRAVPTCRPRRAGLGIPSGLSYELRPDRARDGIDPPSSGEEPAPDGVRRTGADKDAAIEGPRDFGADGWEKPSSALGHGAPRSWHRDRPRPLFASTSSRRNINPTAARPCTRAASHGVGIRHAMAQIAGGCCVATGRDRDPSDTDVTPFDMATLGSRSCFIPQRGSLPPRMLAKSFS
jgi:hypothetical protein